MNEFYNKHYITVDAQNRVTDAWSDGPNPDKDTTGALLVTDQGGYQFRFDRGGEENPALYTSDGIPLYRWDGERIMLRSKAEIEEDRAAIPVPPPSDLERIRADVDFLAAMQGVTL